MDTLIDTIRAIALSDVYLLFCMGVMVVPLIALSLWYHSNINETEGGRALMRKQNAWRDRGGVRDVGDSLETAGDFAKDILSGRYGDEAQGIQKQVYKYVAMWLLACALSFGLIVWAEETKQATEPAPFQQTLNLIEGLVSAAKVGLKVAPKKFVSLT